ncbi:unnamed protein product, partial [Mesorhabditis spiculigera]
MSAGRTKVQRHESKQTDSGDEAVDDAVAEVASKKKAAKKRPPPAEEEEDVEEEEEDPKPLPKRTGVKGKKGEKPTFAICKKPLDDGGACDCTGNDIVCDQVVFDDESELDTLMLTPPKNATYTYFAARENFFPILKKGEILPLIADKIEELDLSKNKLVTIESEAFADLNSLSKLHLNHNKLRRLPKDAFKGVEDKLHQLFLNSNDLRNVEEGTFKSLKSLRRLEMDYSKVKITKGLFEGMDNLEKLSLDGTTFDDNTDVNVFDHLPNLKVLSLRNTHLTEVPTSIQGLKHLEELDLSGTKISELHADSFKNDQSLKILFMQDMPFLWGIEDCAFCGLEGLQEVHFKNSSQLYSVHNNAFGFEKGKDATKSLTKVVFSKCNISTLHEALFDEDLDLDLQLDGNKIICNCNTTWLLGEQRFKFATTSQAPRCAAPEIARNRELMAVDPADVCDAVMSRNKGARMIKWFLMTLMFSTIGVLGYYMVATGKVKKWITPKPRENVLYSNLQTNDEQPLEKDFQPRPQDV